MSSDPNSLLPPVRYRTEFEKSVLISNFEGRSFKRTDSERDWNFLWATVGTIRSMFQTDSNGGYRLNDDQIVNHFPNHYELTRKDLMVKNLKRYRLKLERDGSELAEKSGGGGGNYKHLDFFPATYSMPSEGHLLLDEFKRNLNHIWIAKPNGKSQGKGVFMIHKMNQLKKFLNKLSPNGNSNTMTASMTTTSSTSSAAGASSSSSASSSTPNVGPTERIRDSYVISRYIENPLLIGGKKFDLRLYCLVTNYRPLKVYLYKEGFARFCNVKYSSSLSDLDNPFIHLTNVAIQKHGDDYNMKHGNKWSLRNLRIFLEGTRGSEETQRMFEAITFIMIHSLKSVKDVIQNDKHCFECYGFDLLIDENLKPWLLEVNASPSLSITTKPDRVLKTKLIADLLEVVVPPDFPSTTTSRGTTSWNTKLVVGNFEMIYSEELVQQQENANGNGANGTAGGGGGGSSVGRGASVGGGGGGNSQPGTSQTTSWR